MVRPQRGQMLQVEAQVMPQLEQVLVRAALPALPQLIVQPPFPLAPPTLSKAQLDCGKSGREKNSSPPPCSP